MEPGGIEQQEAGGQIEMINEQVLPKESPIEMLALLGFVFGEDDDDIFVKVKFPDGWIKKATGHSMHTDLLDDKGRKRGGIFYKAAFYDRSANMSLSRRYSVQRNYDGDDSAVQFQVKDCDTVIFETNPVDLSEFKGMEFYNKSDIEEEIAKVWLLEKYPDYGNPMSYWD